MAIRVLVVDDDPGIRDVLKNFLTRCGYEVDTVADGESGLASIRNNPPDVLLLDIYLPEMSGIDVLYALQGDGLEIPTLTFSGMPDDQMARESTLLGATDFIFKPFSLRDLETGLLAKLHKMGFVPTGVERPPNGTPPAANGSENPLP